MRVPRPVSIKKLLRDFSNAPKAGVASEAEYLAQVNPNAFYDPVNIEAIKAKSPKALVATEKRWTEKPNQVPSPDHYKLDH